MHKIFVYAASLTLFLAFAGMATASVRTYPAQKTSTVADLAKRNKVSVEDLCQWNGLQAGEWVEKGQQIYLQDPNASAPASAPVHSRQSTADVDPLAMLGGGNPLGSTGYISPIKPNLSAKEKAALKLSGDYQERSIKPVLTENGRITYSYGATLPSLICAPMSACDVELQQGEVVNDVILGDSVRWKAVLARSGVANAETSHLIFKPLDAGLETMAVITTDRRTYHIKLVSQPKGSMTYVGFTYPADENRNLRTQLQNAQKQEERKALLTQGNVAPEKLNFSYEIKGKAAWLPTQVYSDGRQTFIRLPDTAAHTEIPVLLVRREGQDVLVNYRIKDGAIVVDDLFQEAVLLAGVGSKQQRVTIKRKK